MRLTLNTVANPCQGISHERMSRARLARRNMSPLTGTKPHVISPAVFVRLGPPATAVSGEKGAKMRETRYSDAVDGLHEGQLVSLTGWVQHVKTSGNDCDYHIQLTPSL